MLVKFWKIPMLKLLLLFLTTISLHATVWDLHTNNYLGKIIISNEDTVITSKQNSILQVLPRNISVIKCETQQCRDEVISSFKRLYRTNGITIIKVQ